MTTSEQAFKTVLTVLNRERGMRVRVFRNDPKRLEQKTKEIDDAIEALNFLTKTANAKEAAEQASMFDVAEFTEDYSVGKGVRVASY